MQDQNSETESLINAISAARFSTYRSHSKDDSQAIELYLANRDLAELAFSLIAAFEIELRNKVVLAIRVRFQREDWFRCRGFTKLMKGRGRSDLLAARRSLREKGRAETSGSVCAELSFGFWAATFSGPLSRELWPLLSQNWPHGTKLRKIRSDIHSIRELRNRIAHHEPVFYERWREDAISKTWGQLRTLGPYSFTVLAEPRETSLKSIRSKISKIVLEAPKNTSND